MTEDKSAGWATYYEKLRDRPPRRTLLAALDRFGAPPPDALVIDLGEYGLESLPVAGDVGDDGDAHVERG